MNLAMAYVDPAMAEIGSQMEADMCGVLYPTEVIASSPYDPELSRVRR